MWRAVDDVGEFSRDLGATPPERSRREALLSETLEMATGADRRAPIVGRTEN